MIRSSAVGSALDDERAGRSRPRRVSAVLAGRAWSRSRRRARGAASVLRRDVDRLRVESREVEQLLDQAPHPLALLRERVHERVVLLRRELVAARARSVSAEPEIVVTGVRSSCAASATKFVISRFARSSVTPRVALLREEPRAVEGEQRELPDRAHAARGRRRRRTACTASSRCAPRRPSAGRDSRLDRRRRRRRSPNEPSSAPVRVAQR